MESFFAIPDDDENLIRSTPLPWLLQLVLGRVWVIDRKLAVAYVASQIAVVSGQTYLPCGGGTALRSSHPVSCSWWGRQRRGWNGGLSSKKMYSFGIYCVINYLYIGSYLKALESMWRDLEDVCYSIL